MLGFFMARYCLQSYAALYCNKLEYLNQGKKISAFSLTDFLTKHTLDNLIAYKPITTFQEVERFLYIPTRPEIHFDFGFINLPSLAKGNRVNFRIPARRSWLRNYNWSANGESLAPFVQSFKWYLPLKEYKTWSDRIFTNRVVLNSVAGSSFTEKGEVVYNLPLADSNWTMLQLKDFIDARRVKKCPIPTVFARIWMLHWEFLPLRLEEQSLYVLPISHIMPISQTHLMPN